MNDLKHEKVNLVVGEPFYHGSEGMLPWQNLRFWNERTLLDPLLSEDAFIMPCRGILRLCAMSLRTCGGAVAALKMLRALITRLLMILLEPVVICLESNKALACHITCGNAVITRN
jgi:hypothetical protein